MVPGTLAVSPLVWRNDQSLAPGTGPATTQQGNLLTCSSHSMAKVIQDSLDDQRFEADHGDVLHSLLALFGENQTRASVHAPSPAQAPALIPGQAPGARKIGSPAQPMAHHLHEFQDKEVTVTEKFADGSSSGKTIRLKIQVKTTKTEGKHWGPEDCGFARSPYYFLAVGCLEVPEGNHAVFIKYYNPQTRMVKTINSHGQEGELGAKKDGWVRDTDFHEVNVVQLEKI